MTDFDGQVKDGAAGAYGRVSRRQFLAGASALSFAAAFGAPFARAAEGGEFRWALAEEPDTLDAQLTPRAVSFQVLNYLGDSLLYRDAEGNRSPGLAKSWEVSADGKTVDFVLRDDVTFQDGLPFDAEALAYTFRRGLDPATKSSMFPALVGPVEKVEVVDANTLRVMLKEPYGPLLDNFAARGTSWLQPLSKAAVEKAGAQYGRQPVSTGPWKLESWMAGQEIVLQRNPDYAWGPAFVENKGTMHIEKMRLRIVPEDSSRVAALEAGEIDYAPIPATAYKRFADKPDFTVIRQLRKGTGLVIHFNFKHAPLDDLKVRQAMHLALNREAIVAIAVEGQGIPAFGPLPPSLPYYWAGVEEIGYGRRAARRGGLDNGRGRHPREGRQEARLRHPDAAG